MQALMLWNPAAGVRRRGRIERAAARLRAAGWQLELAATTVNGSYRVVIEQAWRQGVDTFFAAGGDGTLSHAAGILSGLDGRGQRPRLGLLPAGTANVLARHWGLPLDPEAAAMRLSNPRQCTVPIGRARYPDGRRRYFLSMAGVGFDAHLVHMVEGSRWKHLGRAGYALCLLHAALNYHPPKLRVLAGGKEYAAQQILFGLTHSYAGGFQFGSRRDYGIPEVLLIRHQLCGAGIRGLLRGGLPRLAADSSSPGDMHMQWLDCASLRLEGETACVQLDGESAGNTPVEIDLVPRALCLLL